MNVFELIKDLKDFCAAKPELKLILGDEPLQAMVANKIKVDPNDLIVMADFNATVDWSRNTVMAVRYSGVIALGAKTDGNTQATIKETFDEKFDNRLEGLGEVLIQLLKDFCCAKEYQINSMRTILKLNRYAQNIDFVAAEIELEKL